MSERKTIVVNLLGGPCCGKSVTAAALFVALKLKGYVVEYAQEFAKQLVWTKQFNRLDNQHYVTTKQYEILKQMNGVVDFIVTDGPLSHGLYYNMFNKNNTSDKDKTNSYILKCLSEFDNINIFVERGKFKYETEGRIQSEEEAIEIDTVLKHVLKQNSIDFTVINSQVLEDNINKILELINSRIN